MMWVERSRCRFLPERGTIRRRTQSTSRPLYSIRGGKAGRASEHLLKARCKSCRRAGSADSASPVGQSSGKGGMSIAVDKRQVVLLKSRRTNNRFYTLVEPESGFKNADAIDDFPPNLPLGIAYPCLEDGLNDFAVIRTTFETIEVFREDEELREEMMGIIADSRTNLVRRLQE